MAAWFKDMLWRVRPTPGATSAAARKYIPPTNLLPASSMELRSSTSSSESSLPASIQTLRQGSRTMNQQNQTPMPDPANQASSYILFGVQGSRRTLTPSQILINDQSTDSSVFQDLKKCYQTHRGRLRLWFSIWHLEYCEVVKVCFNLIHSMLNAKANN